MPVLSKSGILVVVTLGLIALAGAITSTSYIVAIALIALAAMGTAYLLFIPRAVFLRRKLIDLKWWIPPGSGSGGALRCGQPFRLMLQIRNHSPRPLRISRIRAATTNGFEADDQENLLVPASHQLHFEIPSRASCVGYHVAHGAAVTTTDTLGLFETRSYFPNPIGIRVFPQHVRTNAMNIRQVNTQGLEMPGIRNVSTRGVSGEVRELREYTAGDPFKLIAWKASGRRRKLMVRDMESEVVLSCQIMLDIGHSMRIGATGRTRLDAGIEIATAITEAELDAGNRVGLTTFDSRVYSHVAPGNGHGHRLHLLDRLIELRSVVDEDLTSSTPGTLIGRLADYLLHQEGLDLRMQYTPALDDPKWQFIQAGPDGSLYDLRTMRETVRSFISNLKRIKTKSNMPAWWWDDVQLQEGTDSQYADLRMFCRLRGIELPYATGWSRGSRSSGLLDAVTTSVNKHRCEVIIIISDFAGIFEDQMTVKKAIALARKKGRIVTPWFPSLPVSGHQSAIGSVNMVAKIASINEQMRLRSAQSQLKSVGLRFHNPNAVTRRRVA